MTRQASIEGSQMKIEFADFKQQLDNANKRIYDLLHKNSLLESLVQHSDHEISNFNSSQISNIFPDNSADNQVLLKNTKLLQFQKEDAENKRKNMEQILLIQDQKMKDKESFIRVLTEKVD